MHVQDIFIDKKNLEKKFGRKLKVKDISNSSASDTKIYSLILGLFSDRF
jgi:hypothetical protein